MHETCTVETEMVTIIMVFHVRDYHLSQFRGTSVYSLLKHLIFYLTAQTTNHSQWRVQWGA